jgi:site-specific recombinase XerD
MTNIVHLEQYGNYLLDTQHFSFHTVSLYRSALSSVAAYNGISLKKSSVDTEEKIEALLDPMRGILKDKTVSNYRCALRAYYKFCTQ